MLSGCGDDESPPGFGEATLADLRAGIEDPNKTCAELIEIKNNMDPKSSDYEQAADVLRGVGCYSVDSERTD
jgi:hypothetical protein